MEARLTVPYLASLGWYRAWARGERPECQSRDLVRADLGGLRLTVPLCGGGPALRRATPPEAASLEVSAHGDWPRVHLGALEARCGRLPFYPHLRPEMEKLLREAPGKDFGSLSEGLHSLAVRMLGMPGSLEALRRLRRENPCRAARLAADAGAGLRLDDRGSFWPLLFAVGPEALFLL